MNANLHALMSAAEAALHRGEPMAPSGSLHVGVDLGTAYTVMVALDEHGHPLVAASRYAEVVRDGLVVDFAGATSLVRTLKTELEQRLGTRLSYAATTHPPGVPLAEVRATRYVLEGAGLDVSALVDEPTAANAVLGLRSGAVIDVGGGTTGTAIVANGRVVRTYDEPTGGHHATLVVAGALGISYEQAEQRKTDTEQQQGPLQHLVRPVLEKIATIVQRHIAGHDVERIVLVGGTSAFHRFPEIVTDITGVPATVAPNPMLVTPLGVAMQDPGIGHPTPRTNPIGRHDG